MKIEFQLTPFKQYGIWRNKFTYAIDAELAHTTFATSIAFYKLLIILRRGKVHGLQSGRL